MIATSYVLFDLFPFEVDGGPDGSEVVRIVLEVLKYSETKLWEALQQYFRDCFAIITSSAASVVGVSCMLTLDVMF